MTKPDLPEEEIFKLALKIESRDARETYLKQVCGEKHALFDRLMALLHAHDEESSFLEKPLSDAIVTEIGPVTEQPGDNIGPFKLLQQIGEGGFGVVYMAEQTKPVRRKVALKIIKPGMDSKEVIARFEAERQALALMDHPNIAKVLDAGSTDSGRPFFVMELVKGVPLTEYCDKNHLSGTERLKLFVKVCHAIQHAHQKGVIHRDLKPSNIMVTLHDGKPVPKVIDFGVSKALSQQLTEKTLFTAYGQMVGTPAYMSPEQAEMSGLDIDTRSDVYSLGVLLYELLTGSTPFDAKRLRSAGYAEMQRIIREEEPVRPSTRLTTMGKEASIVSSKRGTDAKKLGQLVRGDLDWIVMKALDKERNRRYETANGFAADIERFLANEPVEACPPSTAYRFRKFARRNKAAFVATTASLGVLLAIAIGSTIAAKQFRDLAQANAKLVVEKEESRKIAVDAEAAAKIAQKDAEVARDQEEDQRIHAEQQQTRAEANYALARSAVDQFLNRVTENQLLTVPGMQPLREELLTAALNFYDQFARDDFNADAMKLELARANFRIGTIRHELQKTGEDRSAYQKSLHLYEELIASGEDSTEIRYGLAKVNFVLDQYDRVIEICQSILETDPEHVESIVLLGDTYNQQGVAHAERAETAFPQKERSESAAALECYRKSLVFRESLVKKFPDNPDYLAGLGGTINNIGVMLSRQGQTDEALQMFKESIRLSDQAYQISPQNLRWGNWLCLGLRNVATKLQEIKNNEEALDYFGRVAQVRRQLMTQNPGIPRLRGQLVFALKELGDFQRRLNLTEEANRTHRSATELLESVPRNTPEEMIELALVYSSLATPPKGVQKELGEQQQADQNYYSEQAWDLVRTAIDKGYRNVAVLAMEPSLWVLRERQDYQELMEKLEQFLLADSVIQSGMENNLQGSNDLPVLDQKLSPTVRTFSDSLEHEKTLAKLGTAIGVVQIGLQEYQKAEQVLNESMERYKKLIVKSPHDRELKLRLLAVRTYLGEIRWNSGRLPEAHAMFSTLLDELEAFPKTPELDPELATLKILAERKICRYYGEIGLWDLAVKYAVRNLRERRIQDPLWDSRFAVLLIGQNSLKDYRDYCRLYYEQFKTSPSSNRDPWENAHLIYTCGLVENPDIPIDERIELGQKMLEEDYSGNRWIMLTHALTLYRAEKYQEALEILPYPDSGLLEFGTGYLHALIQFQLGNREKANKSLDETEQSLMSFCSHPLDEAARKLADPFSERWHELVYDHALRVEAYRTIRGVSDAPDTDLHLVQARAYQLIGQKELAQQHLAQVEQQFLESLGESAEKNSNLSSIAAALAEQLLIQHDKQQTWSALRPATMISQGGATLTLQDDSSILASGNNPLSDGYTITVPVREPMKVSWIRLEALTHESLPKQGPGRDPAKDPGNFGMHSFQVSLRNSNLGLRPVVLSRVTTGDVNYNFPVTLTHWNYSGQTGRSHSAYYQLESPVQLDVGSEIMLEMQFSPHPDWPRQNLGCFRLSVSDDPGILSISDPFARLAATYDMLGEEQNVQKILVSYPSSGAAFAEYLVSIREWDRGIHEFSKLIEVNSNDIRLLIKRAAVYAKQDQWDLAQADWEQALGIAGDDPALLLERAKFYATFGKWKLAQADALRAVELAPQEIRTVFEFCQQAERWEEAAIFGLKLIDREPDDSMTWLNVAPAIALADQKDQYTRFCERMLERFSDDSNVVIIERLCHAALIDPETVDVSRVPGEALAKAMEENQNLQDWFPQWGWSSLALWRYRNGEPELALECAQKARKLADTPYVAARSLALIALSQHELQNEDAAREALEELTQLVSSFSYKETNNHDQLIPKILLREAESKIGR